MKENPELRVIRASEIGEYVFCHRAWWLHQIQGVESANREQMNAGVARHQAHGRAVKRSDTFQRAAIIFVLVAIVSGILLAMILLNSSIQ